MELTSNNWELCKDHAGQTVAATLLVFEAQLSGVSMSANHFELRGFA